MDSSLRTSASTHELYRGLLQIDTPFNTSSLLDFLSWVTYEETFD